MVSPSTSVVALALGVALSSCGDPGYSFGRYDEEIAEVAPFVDRYCMKAMECAPHAIGTTFDECRILLIPWLLEIAMECTRLFEALTECADHSSCVEFPILSRGIEGNCGAELHAFETCASPITGTGSGVP